MALPLRVTNVARQMNDPHVVALYYKIEHDAGIDYSRAEPFEVRHDAFDVRVEDGQVRFSMNDHFATERDTRDAVAGYIRAWELDAALAHGPNAFKLRFDRSDIEDRNPKPDAKYERGGPIAGRGTPICAVGTLGEARGTLLPRTYPLPPPTGLKRSPDVESMFYRYVGYREGKEPLTAMAYFCLTVLEASTGKRRGQRAAAAKRYHINRRVLNQLAELSTTKGGASARKAEGVHRDLTHQERQFLEAAVKKIIRRAAEVADDPDASLEEITLPDFPLK